ncbi:MAG: hypothetical protein ABIG68_03775 [Acidobacteriota bacterium]
MRAIFGIPALLLAVVIIHYLYSTQHSAPHGQLPPSQQIDLVAVRTDLLAIAQAERLYLASHGQYGTLDQLVQSGSLGMSGAGRHGYRYDVVTEGGIRFRITARPSASSGTGRPTLSIDETMQIKFR